MIRTDRKKPKKAIAKRPNGNQRNRAALQKTHQPLSNRIARMNKIILRDAPERSHRIHSLRSRNNVHQRMKFAKQCVRFVRQQIQFVCADAPDSISVLDASVSCDSPILSLGLHLLHLRLANWKFSQFVLPSDKSRSLLF